MKDIDLRYSVNILITLLCGFLLSGSGYAASDQQPRSVQPAALEYAGIYRTHRLYPEILGTDIKITMICRSLTYHDGLPQNDFLPDLDHICLAKAGISASSAQLPAPNLSQHATAVAAIIAGRDPNGYVPEIGEFSYVGAAPAARIDACEFHYFVNKHLIGEGLPSETDIFTISLGTVIPDWWTNKFDKLISETGKIVVAGIGNGTDVCDPVLYPASNPNCLGVGVCQSVNSKSIETYLANFWLPSTANSSRGPTEDLRSKPDIVAGGNCLVPLAGSANEYVISGSYSSFATPIAASAAALILQKARQNEEIEPLFKSEYTNCLIKSILMTSAYKAAWWHKGRWSDDDDHSVSLDNCQGAGILDASAGIDLLDSGRYNPEKASPNGWDSSKMTETEPLAYRINLNALPGRNDYLTATINWNIKYRNEYPFEPDSRRNFDVRLEIWAIDPANPQRDYLLDYCYSPAENLQHIHTRLDGAYSNYEIVALPVCEDHPAEPRTQQIAISWATRNIKPRQDIYLYDLNGDGIVNNIDYDILISRFTDAIDDDDSSFTGDFNNDGAIDFSDLRAMFQFNLRKAAWYEKSLAPAIPAQ